MNHSIGMAYYGLSAHSSARAHLERSLEAWKEAGLADSEAAAATLTSLGNTLFQANELQAAGDSLRAALDTHERLHGPDHCETLNALGNLAVVRFHSGDRQGAVEMCRRVVDGYRREGLIADEAALRQLGTLGKLAIETGEIEAGKEFLEEAETGMERSLSPDHPELQFVRLLLARIDFEENELEEAQRRAETALGFLVDRLGSHPDTMNAYYTLAAIAWAREDHVRAEDHASQALAIASHCFGEQGWETAVIRSNHALYLCILGRHVEALEEFRLAHEVLAPSGIYADEAAFNLLDNQVNCHLERDDWIASIEACETLVAGRERLLGPSDRKTASARGKLAEALAASGDLEAASDVFAIAVADLRSAYGDDSPTVRRAALRFVSILDRLEREEQAESLRDELSLR